MGFLFNPVFRFFFRCCDTGHRIGINIRAVIIDGKEMSVWEKELLPVDDGVLRTLDGKRCVHWCPQKAHLKKNFHFKNLSMYITLIENKLKDRA